MSGEDRTPRTPTIGEAILLRFFEYEHLPERLRSVSRPFAELAHFMVAESEGASAELTTGLRKLLESKDCYVRSHLDDDIHRCSPRSDAEQ